MISKFFKICFLIYKVKKLHKFKNFLLVFNFFFNIIISI